MVSRKDTVLPSQGLSFGAEVDGIPAITENEREIANRVSTVKGGSSSP